MFKLMHVSWVMWAMLLVLLLMMQFQMGFGKNGRQELKYAVHLLWFSFAMQVGKAP
jgi:hypothetical protein